jgi:broad specificity phosphatase PhoE
VDHSSILVDERIIEGGFGKWEGQLKPTIDPHSHAERLAGGVEDPSAIEVRMLAFWNDLVADSALVGKNVLVVGHGWSLRILFLALAEGGILAHCVVPRTLGNCSITTIVVTRTGGSGYRAEMTDLDNVEHFDSEEITAIE